MSHERNFVISGPGKGELGLAEKRGRELFFTIVHESGQACIEVEVSLSSVSEMSDGVFRIEGTASVVGIPEWRPDIVIEKYNPKNGSGVSWFPQ